MNIIGSVTVNMDDATDLLLAVLVRRLRELKWGAGEVSMIADKAIDMMASRIEDIQMAAAKDAALIAAGGAPQKSLQSVVLATFAMAGYEMAEDLNKTRIAGLN